MDYQRTGRVVHGWPEVEMPPPHNTAGTWVEVWVDIRCERTGEVRRHVAHELMDGDGISWFLWSDGNFSCDCNRSQMFREAGGEATNWDDVSCGDGAFQVRTINPLTGALHYDEIGGEAHGSEEGRRKEVLDAD